MRTDHPDPAVHTSSRVFLHRWRKEMRGRWKSIRTLDYVSLHDKREKVFGSQFGSHFFCFLAYFFFKKSQTVAWVSGPEKRPIFRFSFSDLQNKVCCSWSKRRGHILALVSGSQKLTFSCSQSCFFFAPEAHAIWQWYHAVRDTFQASPKRLLHVNMDETSVAAFHGNQHQVHNCRALGRQYITRCAKD